MSENDLRALVVEDDQLFRNHALVPLIQRAGLEVEVAGNVKEGVAKLAEQAFDIIFVDFYLPDGTGCELMDRITVDGGGRPYVILVSGISDVPKMKDASRSGARDFLIKPFDSTEFREVLRRAKKVLAAAASPLPFWVEKYAVEFANRRTTEMLAARYEGLTNREVAERFGLVESGVKYLLRIEFFAPLGAGSLSQLDSAAKAWFERKLRE